MEGTMLDTTGSRRGLIGALAGLVVALVLALPSSASAQVDIEKVGESVGDKVDETVDDTTDAVDDTVDQVEDTADEATGSETVDEVTDTLNDTVEDVGRTVDRTTDSVTDEVDRATAPIQDAINDTSDRSGSVVDSLLGGNERRNGADAGRTQTIARDRRVVKDSDAGVVRSKNVRSGDRVAPRNIDGPEPTSADAGPAREIIQTIGDIAGAIAFPIVLLLMVGAFLVFQGRVDRSDPKLSLAPVDVESEYLSFR